MKRIGIVITPAQPLDINTEKLIRIATEHSYRVLVMIGSTNRATDCMRPLAFKTIQKMLNNVVDHDKVSIVPLKDTLYNDAAWIQQIHEEVSHLEDSIKDTVRIVDHCKAQQYYDQTQVTVYTYSEDIANDYPTFKTEVFDALVPQQQEALEMLYEGKDVKQYFSDTMYNEVMSYFSDDNPDALNMKQEYEYIKKYKQAWHNAPYQPTFVTTDAVVYFKGYVLLVKRKAQPGKGLWALPGGFINQYEEVVDSLVRELKEETRIKVGKPILKSNIRNMEVFSDPYRSLRGRTITHAGLIVLDGVTTIQTLPKVKGGDDASHAKWFSIQEIEGMATNMFEDHYHIVKKMLHIG